MRVCSHNHFCESASLWRQKRENAQKRSYDARIMEIWDTLLGALCPLVPVYWWVRYRTIVPPNRTPKFPSGLGVDSRYTPLFTGGERENRLSYGNKIISPATRISSLWHKKTLGMLQHSATLHLEALQSIPHTILFSLPLPLASCHRTFHLTRWI
jgi:hypothetical protein